MVVARNSLRQIIFILLATIVLNDSRASFFSTVGIIVPGRDTISSTRALGMGGASLAGGLDVASFLKQPGNLLNMSRIRFFPYDLVLEGSFAAFPQSIELTTPIASASSGIKVIRNSEYLRLLQAGGGAFYRLRIGAYNFGFGIGSYIESSFQTSYKGPYYDLKVLEDGALELGEADLNIGGQFRNMSFAISFGGTRLAGGAFGRIVTGSKETKISFTPNISSATNPSDFDQTIEYSSSLALGGGITVAPGKFRISLSYEKRLKANYTFKDNVSGLSEESIYHLGDEIGFGFSFFDPKGFDTWINFDMTIRFFDRSVDLYDLSSTNRQLIPRSMVITRVGAEHRLRVGKFRVPIRYGFLSLRHHTFLEMREAGISMGLGIGRGPWDIDIAYIFTRRSTKLYGELTRSALLTEQFNTLQIGFTFRVGKVEQ